MSIHKKLLSIPDNKPIRSKIGVTTGNVFAGAVGSKRRCEYAVIGDVVNLSARLMCAMDGVKVDSSVSILCDSVTMGKAKGKIHFNSRGSIPLKGKSGEVIDLSYRYLSFYLSYW
jgi:adenylate cyclase